MTTHPVLGLSGVRVRYGGAAVLDVCGQLQLVEQRGCDAHKAQLERVGQMLTKLIKVHK